MKVGLDIRATMTWRRQKAVDKAYEPRAGFLSPKSQLRGLGLGGGSPNQSRILALIALEISSKSELEGLGWAG